MIFLASSLPAHPGWAQNVQYQLTGFLVVIFTLGALGLFVWILGKFFTRAGSPQPKPEPPPAEAPTGEEIPGTVLAAISTAVSVTLQGKHFVIYDVSAAGGTGRWSAEGRRAIYRSHKLR
jgi:hypothetical protein